MRPARYLSNIQLSNSRIQNAERILVLTEEGIAEEGSHQALLEKGGIYEKLYHMHRAEEYGD